MKWRLEPCIDFEHRVAVLEQNDILKGVSRSFYLSMRFLPAPMREPISVAYLLARASDTIADTSDIEPQLKLQILADLVESIDAFKPLHLPEASIRNVTNPKEQLLLSNIKGVIEGGQKLPVSLQECVQKVVRTIVSGQSLDVQRFDIDHASIGCESDLLDYCYRVAGCVGEFWTEVGFLTCDNFATLPEPELKELGKNYGVGLQLINILRDIPIDLEQGRVYLPEKTILEKGGVQLWIDKAKTCMEDGLAYTDSLNSRRCRLATYLPAALGLETLHLLELTDSQVWRLGPKVKRSTVYKTIVEGLLR